MNFRMKIPEDSKWLFQSHVGFDQTWGSYFAQYNAAVDNLVEAVQTGAVKIDQVSLPMIFLIRHVLELGLKNNVAQLEKINGKEGKLRPTHNLEALITAFNLELSKILDNNSISETTLSEITKYRSKLAELGDTIHNLDRGSDAFRYPVDKNNAIDFDWNKTIAVDDILHLFFELRSFFAFTIAVLADEGVKGVENL